MAFSALLSRRGEPMICSPTGARNLFYGSTLQGLIMQDARLIRAAVAGVES
ncbi:hypothetical protein ABKS89_16130 [Pseudomonas sp. LABIM340]|uniref:hypothetical protein n=1 Tax=Pseudomonas sp. LABIM340 TaxID=3156585 RepID=UPI0032AE837D